MYRVRVLRVPFGSALEPAARTLRAGLREAGMHDDDAGRTIVLGAHDRPGAVGASDLIYQTEPPPWSVDFAALLGRREHDVLSYAPGLPGRWCPLGYVETPIVESSEPAVDLFFAGNLTPRRQHVLQRCREAGLTVRAVSYGQALFDADLARAESMARVVVNIHAQVRPLGNYFASSRVVPAVSRGRLVVSEDAPGTAYSYLTDVVGFPEAVRTFCRDPDARETVRLAMLAALKRDRMADILRRVLS